MHALRRHRHLALLLVMIGGLSLQPTTQLTSFSLVSYELILYALIFVVFLGVFERRGERRIAVAAGLAAIAANFVGHVSTGLAKTVVVLGFHGLLIGFLAFGVGVILRGIFSSGRIGSDQIFGAFTGYLLAGVAWGNAYVVVYLLIPDAYQLADGLAVQLQGEDTRRFLFEYYSFMTLTTVGYGDVTPLAPAACTLAWLEAMFGQFYTAVFIGQLIGLKLAQPRDAATT